MINIFPIIFSIIAKNIEKAMNITLLKLFLSVIFSQNG